jgi:four helix bundle protein
MNRDGLGGKYDLEDRTLQFAKRVRGFIKRADKNLLTIDDYKQLLRSSGYVGANYIEANESLGKKDFLMRIRISRKEAKESMYWLMLLGESKDGIIEADRKKLIQEAKEHMFIFGAILKKSNT